MAEGEGVQSGAEGTQSGAGDITTDGSTSTVTEGAQGGATGTATDSTDLERRAAEADSLRERMRAADQRASKFEQELKQLRDKDLPEADKLKRDFEESQNQVVKLQETNGRLAAEIAFLKENTFTWHDPATALKLVDMSQVTVNDDGSTNGMKDAIKALATSHPFLVKQDVKEEKAPPATSPGNNGTGKANGSKPGSLQNRFPVMRTRRSS